MMNDNKPKIVIDHESADITPHDFEKRLIRESKDIFIYNESGHIQGLDYLKYGQAATTLLSKLLSKGKQK
jgi:hypothetical protein